MKIKVLGTSSPYAYENSACPSYYIYDDKLNILLDCGSGSHRFFDMQKNLNGLNIFVSHLHHDHYNDLFNYLYSAYALHNLGLINEKIQVFLPNFPNNIYENIIKEQNCYADFHTIDENLHLSIGNASISFCEIKHAKDVKNFAIKVTQQNKSIVYSGDLSFIDKDKMIDFAKNSDILICESSLLKKHNFPTICNHLTAYQAGFIAKKAKVKKLLLTHFWPDENANEYKLEAQTIFDKVEIAKEKLIVDLGE